MKITFHGAMQVIAFVLLTLLATSLLVAAGLNEESSASPRPADVNAPHPRPG